MSLFSVTYQLNNDKDYPKLWDEFDRLSAQKVQNSQYFVSLGDTAKEVKDHFAGFVDDDDMIMVVKFTTRPIVFKILCHSSRFVKNRNDYYDQITTQAHERENLAFL